MNISRNQIKTIYCFKNFKNPIFNKGSQLKGVSLIKTNQLNGSWIAILIKLIIKKPLLIRTGYDAFIFSIRDKKSIFKKVLYYLLTQMRASFF